MSKTTAYYHVVFCTKAREMTIPLEHCEHLYRFLWKEIRELNCTLLRVGGIQNHVHMLVNLNAMVPLAKLVQNCKTRSSVWLKNDERFPHFNGWSEGYFACTLAPDQRHAVIEYIKPFPRVSPGALTQLPSLRDSCADAPWRVPTC